MCSNEAHTVLTELDRLAPQLLGEGRPVRVLEQARTFADSNFDGHPWARLLVGCALSDADPCDARGERHTRAALEAFRCSGDTSGQGYACFILGCRALERGDIPIAAWWWQTARQVAGAGMPGFGVMLAHLGLDTYAKGQLKAALAVTEEAVALARLGAASRAEAAALVNIGFFRLWTGDFDLALDALNAAEDGFEDIPDPFDRYEQPLCFAARGTVWALRGVRPAAERNFDRALELARDVEGGWYDAITRALRAEFTAQWDHRRARRDARIALAELKLREDQWWRAWAEQAAAVAASEARMPDAAEAILREILNQPQPVVEEARTRLLLGETLLKARRAAEAIPFLREAMEVFQAASALYWEARCCVRLARADPEQARTWMVSARRIATDDPAYERLFRDGELRLVAFGPGLILTDDQPLAFRTHAAERAVFLLALAGPDGLHVEELADRLWPEAVVDRTRLLGRIRTLLWDVRQGLGGHSWRLERDRSTIRFDLFGAAFDLAEARASAKAKPDSGPRPAEAATQLKRPLLTRWAYEEWVQEERLRNESLAEQIAPA